MGPASFESNCKMWQIWVSEWTNEQQVWLWRRWLMYRKKENEDHAVAREYWMERNCLSGAFRSLYRLYEHFFHLCAVIHTCVANRMKNLVHIKRVGFFFISIFAVFFFVLWTAIDKDDRRKLLCNEWAASCLDYKICWCRIVICCFRIFFFILRPE